MTVQIEDASMRLLSELYEIEKQCFQEEAFSKQQIGYLLTDYNAVSLVAKVDDEIAGFIIGRIELTRNLLLGHIMTIDVAPLYRRKGIAQRLMLEVEETFRQKSVREIHLEVREGNSAALGLYKKLGFEKISRLENYYGKAHGLYLRKNLQ
jgi:[ribosomal protein S18]-alanine N-acetyltransferase